MLTDRPGLTAGSTASATAEASSSICLARHYSCRTSRVFFPSVSVFSSVSLPPPLPPSVSYVSMLPHSSPSSLRPTLNKPGLLSKEANDDCQFCSDQYVVVGPGQLSGA